MALVGTESALVHFSDGASAPNPSPSLAGAHSPAPRRRGAPCAPSLAHLKNALAISERKAAP